MAMTLPQTRYATTSDGVSLAYWTMGDGDPYVVMPALPWSHIELEFETPGVEGFYRALATERMLVRYDNRGSGLSQRDVTDVSLDAMVRDLETVVDHLGLEKFALAGFIHAGPPSIAYAARHPERVSHLVLWCTYARASDYVASQQVQATRDLRSRDWTLYTETLAHVTVGWEAGEHAHRYAAILRECVTREQADAIYEATTSFDVMDDLASVKAPTLVFHRRDLAWLDADIARSLAAGIPDARLIIVEGTSAMPYLDNFDTTNAILDEFLSDPSS
jgi:Predicted hydrolases or acyltransferases (alpha/beta hydrolase superfamily)